MNQHFQQALILNGLNFEVLNYCNTQSERCSETMMNNLHINVEFSALTID